MGPLGGGHGASANFKAPPTAADAKASAKKYRPMVHAETLEAAASVTIITKSANALGRLNFVGIQSLFQLLANASIAASRAAS